METTGGCQQLIQLNSSVMRAHFVPGTPPEQAAVNATEHGFSIFEDWWISNLRMHVDHGGTLQKCRFLRYTIRYSDPKAWGLKEWAFLLTTLGFAGDVTYLYSVRDTAIDSVLY